ncbi:uncharacterized protein LOC106871806 [Octopus bimaculoides]|uniref:uncharacterized protein LOC106871806 n=1 Tax=Octopus bimaculoides TaxID=37653 RepID=UPI00071C5C57|nr:uncharacterized protein LOC106871806 [Octopus bimaculoides]|eukprot:XP_014773941.1 PREDICTED: uncharacterized protein LOC106871806 [Octopus bimaculoides]
MTSFGANVVQEGGFMPNFEVQGQVYHRIGSLKLAENQDPQFLQLYFVGNLHEQATRRNSISNGTKFQLIMQLQDLLHQTNSYVRSFKYALETEASSNFNVIIDAQKRPSTEHGKSSDPYNVTCTQSNGMSLPHAHVLLWLSTKIKSTDIDNIISAELPDPALDKVLYDIVKANMVHGPCGCGFNITSPCLKGSVCSKKFPRKFLQQAQTGAGGYPSYRRRKPQDGSVTATIGQHAVDNRWIVLYCPLLSKIFNDQINVEFCNSVKSIKYVCKYVNKGSDAAMFALQQQYCHDEVTHYQTCELCDPATLWLKYRDNLAEDFHRQAQRLYPDMESISNEVYNKTLIDIEDRIATLGGNELSTYGLPQTFRSGSNSLPTAVIRETSYDIQALSEYIAENEHKLLPDQLQA